MKSIFRIATLAIFLFSVGCAGGPRPRAALSPALQTEIITSLKNRDERLHSLRGLASVRVGRGIFGTRGETAFAIQKPGRVRIDGLSDFGLYASQLSLHGNLLTVVWPQEHLYYRGQATSEVMQRFLLVDLPTEEVERILMNRVFFSLTDLATLEKKKNRYQLKTPEGLVMLESREGEYLPVQVTVFDEKGKKSYEVTYEEFFYSQGLWVPKRLQVRFWNPKVTMDLRFKDLEVNPKLNDKIFQIAIPDDADEISF